MIPILIKAGIMCLCFFVGIILTFGGSGIIQNIGILLFIIPIFILLLAFLKLILSVQVLSTISLAVLIFVIICLV
jgi:hypothetical protein